MASPCCYAKLNGREKAHPISGRRRNDGALCPAARVGRVARSGPLRHSFLRAARFSRHLSGRHSLLANCRRMPGEKFLDNIARGRPMFPAEHPTRVRPAGPRADSIHPARPGDRRHAALGSDQRETGKHDSAVMINAYWSPFAKRRSILPELPLTRVIPPRFLGGIYKWTEPIAFAFHVAQMNRIRKEFGLASLPPDLRDLYTAGDHVLYADVPDFIPTPGAPSHHHYVGICEWTPATAKPDWWPKMLEDCRPKVFVSLGSSGPVRVLPAFLKALSKLPVAVVLSSSGRALPPRGQGIYTADLLPFTETAAQCRVVVSHGGSGGLYPAMAAGTPVLGIPSNADQQLSTAVLQDNGAGLGVRVEEASEPRLRQALEKLLFEPEYHASAQRWAAIFARYQSRDLFQQFLEQAFEGERVVAGTTSW